MKPMPPRDRGGGADADGCAADDHVARGDEVDAEAGGGFLAEAERVERAGGEGEDEPADEDERGGEGDVVHRAIGDRAHQPEHDLGGGIGVGRQIERERHQRGAEAGDGDAGEDEREHAASSGEALQQQRAEQRAGDAHHRQGEREGHRDAGVEREHGAERWRRT